MGGGRRRRSVRGGGRGGKGGGGVGEGRRRGKRRWRRGGGGKRGGEKEKEVGGGEAENVKLTRYVQKIHCTHLNLSRAVLHMRSLHSTTAASHFCLCSLSRMKSAEVRWLWLLMLPPLHPSPPTPPPPPPSLPPGDKTSHLYAYIHIHKRATVIQD